ncbi:INO80 complex subunit B [Empidonax traillii]|uniref:INO80 complex subunit B n=1 Tax=Empidonax traillii TaxID=164674 RepID=UPI000FFD8795|nr:INO80 complex subunit B [Empidonax traillii]
MRRAWRGAMEAGHGQEAEAGGHGGHKKKHKKHKKKHKKRHHHEAGPPPGPEPPRQPRLRLRIKLGGQILGTKSVPTFTVVPEGPRSPSPLLGADEEEPSEGVPIEQYRAWLDEDSNLAPSPLPELDPESCFSHREEGEEEEEEEEEEERRWLAALERGELDDNGDIKREVDESLLTARQRALLHKQQSQPLLQLPMGAKAKEVTEEMREKREERARRRRLQAARKAEESKNQTIERLTRTHKAKVRALRERRARPAPCPVVHYHSSAQGVTLSFPPGLPLPLPPATAPPVPTPQLCAVPGCTNARRYRCARTGRPLCSLGCYQRNLQLLQSPG